MNKIFFSLIGLMLLGTDSISAQSDFGIWTSVGANKKINKQWSVSFGAEWRTRQVFGRNERWSAGLETSYKATNWLKVSVGYDLLYDYNEKTTFHDEPEDMGKAFYMKPNKYAAYWGVRHRLHTDLTGDVDFGRWNIQLRERWQYTYRPEKTIAERYDYDDDEMDGKPKTYAGKGSNLLRSRLQVAYNVPGVKLEPYANVEIYNRPQIDKTRYTTGIEWKIGKKHELDLYYRYQYSHDEEDLIPHNHILGIGYQFNF